MIRFGMTLMELIGQLTRGYVKATGKQPDNLAKIKIRQEALKRLESGLWKLKPVYRSIYGKVRSHS